jgi:RHH-type proline utilization regulon transcriptional repressor/proline dehydrogenase/delta 1-pyrroline-5-carboxylate dehydrogenase
MKSTAVTAAAPESGLSIAAISARAFMDEAQAVEALLAHVAPLASLDAQIMATARPWAQAIREGGPGHGMEAFLHTYGLDTREGVALMCLAEALLRIPDGDTADRLIRDTFEDKDWRGHIEGGEPWLVSASSWGLLLTGKVVDFGQDTAGGIAGTLRALVGKAGDPVIRQALRQAMRIIGSQFVLGEDIKDGLNNAKPFARQGYRFSFDILGEGARSDAQAQGYIKSYHEAIALIGNEAKGQPLFTAPSISVKLSALHARYSLSQKGRVLEELLPRLKGILRLAKQHNITVSIDAEEANRLDIEMILFSELLADPEFVGWNGIGFVLQAYQKRAFHVVDFLAELAQKHHRIIPLRLVKGAYWDSEIKHAQLHGLPDYPVFTRKAHTDLSYLACADKILSAGCFYPQFATHNARTVASICALAKRYNVGRDGFEFQRLHGMGEKLHALVLKDYASRIYAPIGEHKDLLAYLIRRLLENGANTSFVNLLMDKETTLENLLADPVAQSKAAMGAAIDVPALLYGDRGNSRGADMGYLFLREAFEREVAKHHGLMHAMTPARMQKDDIFSAIAGAQEAQIGWARESVEVRCLVIEKAAELIEAHIHPLMALLAAEGGKTFPDAIAEVREAADFCRYYALMARRLMASPHTLTGPTGESNQLALHSRGVFCCISPWNFPLAIFTGQVVAALVTGNAALAKPADQTMRIAAYAVKLLHEAGVPRQAVQLLPASGSLVGQTAVADARVAGIVFTGSVEVAQTINKTLAQRPGPIVPFIAETGGQNCMVVDSSALLEQAVDDIVLSSFGSAGQRCSALRVLYVQEEIAGKLMELLAGAMQELRLGNPAELSTDVGPVIDAKAQKELGEHIAKMKTSAKFVASVPPSKAEGSFVAPHAFEIDAIARLEKEVFGPVLHIVRFKAGQLQQVADAINSTGFGLTFGIHSRIGDNIDFFTARIHAGNIYVNRSMIGAVVGVQPFGGEGLSGTGPKAGGPHYLPKFLYERTISNNTAAIGGNVALLAGKTAS